MDVVQARLEDGVRSPLLPERDQQLEMFRGGRERANVEVVDGQVGLGDAELGGGRAPPGEVSGGSPREDFVAIEKAT
jgi:hypothetical protein